MEFGHDMIAKVEVTFISGQAPPESLMVPPPTLPQIRPRSAPSAFIAGSIDAGPPQSLSAHARQSPYFRGSRIALAFPCEMSTKNTRITCRVMRLGATPSSSVTRVGPGQSPRSRARTLSRV